MKAIIYDTYGPPEVLQIKEVPTPTLKDNELLIEVRATTVTSGDVRMRALNVPPGFGIPARLGLGIFAPRRQILGMEFAGVVAAVGKRVTRFKVGTPVFGMSDAFGGCYAEYCVFPEDGGIAEKPANLTFEEAASLCFGGTTALDFFRRGKLKSGDRILINGASGAVGTAAVQLARHLGAHVTGVCSTANLELVRSLGADAVIDYTKTDFTRNGESYDLIMDTAGTAPFSRSQDSLKPGGRLLLVLGGMSETLASFWVNLTNDKKVIAGVAKVRAEDVNFLGKLAAAGQFRPVIDRTWPFEQIAEAHAYVDKGHKKGNVVIKVGNSML